LSKKEKKTPEELKALEKEKGAKDKGKGKKKEKKEKK